MSKSKQAVTAKDIARECGISQATVSYVINNTPGKTISEATRALVLETALRLDYIPNSAARGMRTRFAGSVGVVLGRNGVNVGFSHVLRGVRQVLADVDYTVTLLHDQSTGGEDADRREYASFYRSHRVDGLLFSFCEMDAETLSYLGESGIPYVVVNGYGVWTQSQPQYQSIENAIGQCVSLCREKELRRIRFYNFQRGQKTTSRKYDLFEAACRRDYPEAELLRVVIPTEGRDNEALLAEILAELDRGEPFDLAVSSNQRLGFLVQNAILRRRFELPQKPRHICLDDAHASRLLYPTLTSLKIPLVEMGGYAARQLLGMVRGSPFEAMDFQYTLRLGDSTD